jgi:hypothetical protein
MQGRCAHEPNARYPEDDRYEHVQRNERNDGDVELLHIGRNAEAHPRAKPQDHGTDEEQHRHHEGDVDQAEEESGEGHWLGRKVQASLPVITHSLGALVSAGAAVIIALGVFIGWLIAIGGNVWKWTH